MSLPPRTLAALLATAARLDAAGVDWLLVGGAARALAGARRRPADLDVEVDPPDLARAAAALGAAARERVDARMRSWCADARIAGVPVELCAGLAVTGPELTLPSDWAAQRAWAQRVAVAGRAVACAPPEELLVRALVAGDVDGLRRRLDPELAPPRAAYVAARLAAATSSATS